MPRFKFSTRRAKSRRCWNSTETLFSRIEYEDDHRISADDLLGTGSQFRKEIARSQTTGDGSHHGPRLQHSRAVAELRYRSRPVALAILVDVRAAVCRRRDGQSCAALEVNSPWREAKSRIDRLGFALGQIRRRVE